MGGKYRTIVWSQNGQHLSRKRGHGPVLAWFIDSDRQYNFYVTTYCVSQEHTGILCNCEVRLYINFVSVDKLNSGYSHIPIELVQVIFGALL